MEKPFVDLSHPTKSQKMAHALLTSILLGFGVYLLIQGILNILASIGF
jgi:hypothetical protein